MTAVTQCHRGNDSSCWYEDENFKMIPIGAWCKASDGNYYSLYWYVHLCSPWEKKARIMVLNIVARTQKQDEKLIMNEAIVCGFFNFPEREFNANSSESYNDASRAYFNDVSLNIAAISSKKFPIVIHVIAKKFYGKRRMRIVKICCKTIRLIIKVTSAIKWIRTCTNYRV